MNKYMITDTGTIKTIKPETITGETDTHITITTKRVIPGVCSSSVSRSYLKEEIYNTKLEVLEEYKGLLQGKLAQINQEIDKIK